MNLTKMFEAQKVLMDRIEKEHPTQPGENRFDKKVLALLVEVGECANEQRSWKYWSKDQEPRVERICLSFRRPDGAFQYKTNPLLEEYVDGLHFVLELGIEIDFDYEEWLLEPWKEETIELQFIQIIKIATSASGLLGFDYLDLFQFYLGLGEMLGFTWEQIEQAYFEKNKINHDRQESGY